MKKDNFSLGTNHSLGHRICFISLIVSNASNIFYLSQNYVSLSLTQIVLLAKLSQHPLTQGTRPLRGDNRQLIVHIGTLMSKNLQGINKEPINPFYSVCMCMRIPQVFCLVYLPLYQKPGTREGERKIEIQDCRARMEEVRDEGQRGQVHARAQEIGKYFNQ